MLLLFFLALSLAHRCRCILNVQNLFSIYAEFVPVATQTQLTLFSPVIQAYYHCFPSNSMLHTKPASSFSNANKMSSSCLKHSYSPHCSCGMWTTSPHVACRPPVLWAPHSSAVSACHCPRAAASQVLIQLFKSRVTPSIRQPFTHISGPGTPGVLLT